jgi:hypothetical protein
MAGPLGTRGFWEYKSDGGNTYQIKHRDADATATSMTPAVADANPDKPLNLKCRGVWAQSTLGRRLFICGTNADTLYTSGGTISCDGASWKVTGRHGERQLGSATG